MKQRNRRPDLFINLLIGASDGLIVPAALFAALTAAGSEQHMIISVGLPMIGIASVIMGIGGYLTRKHAEIQPANLVHDELRGHKGKDREETARFYANLGLTTEMQEQALAEMDKDDSEWKKFVERYDLDPMTSTPATAGWMIGTSYAVAGLLSLTPFWLYEQPRFALASVACICFPLLFLLGFLKGKLTRLNPIRNGLLLMATGVLATGVAYAVLFFLKR